MAMNTSLSATTCTFPLLLLLLLLLWLLCIVGVVFIGRHDAAAPANLAEVCGL